MENIILINERIASRTGKLLAVILFLLCLSPLYSYGQPTGARITNPIVMGVYGGGTFSYSDTKNNGTIFGYLNDYGQPSHDIYYRFTVQGTARVDISHCSSGFDTYMHLLNSSGGLIMSNDDNGPLCSGLKASIQTTLAAGTYYIVSEGYSSNSGNITTSVLLVVEPPIGARMSNPIIMGNYTPGTYTYTDTKNNSPSNGYLNDIGHSSDDIYYQFTVQGNAQVNVSHCSSGFDTYLHLLNGAGSVIATNDDYGPLCSGVTASLQANLSSGTYYIVSEGFSSNAGNITTAVTLTVQSDFVYDGWNPNHKIGTASGNYNSATISWPEQLVELYPAGIPNVGLSYQWEVSTSPVSGFADIPGATLASYSLSNPGQTMYYRRKSINGTGFIYSNTLKIASVSPDWEDRNYVREHDVVISGISSSQAVYQLPIGQRMQTTTYLDGLGRSIETVSREMATPSNPASLWGDVVQFTFYDAYGREPVKYLPYTTTTQSGKYKTAPLSEQPQYYINNYSETSAAATITYDNSPLNRVSNIKQPGTAWNNGPGLSAKYDLNDAADDVRIFTVDYVQGNAPVSNGSYPANTLYKFTTTDENGKKVIEFVNKKGQIILKKVQLDDYPSATYPGWICTFFVYDDFGLLKYQIQPEAVKYLDTHSWSFAGVDGQTILAEQCFQYNYNDKGRMTWKKAPGASPLSMIYDRRDRLVFHQDGNQASLPVPQWTTSIYDELDRVIVATLYNTNKSVADLQTDLNNAPANSTITINNAGTVSVTVNTSLNPLTSSTLNNVASTTVLKYSFYEGYSFGAVKAFNTGFTNTTAYSPSDPNVMPIAWSKRTTGMLTGSMMRVLGTNTFLTSTVYYDERGSVAQTLTDNIKSGTDITTFQYHFDGRVLSTCSDHTTPGTGYTNYKTLTKVLHDKIGRVSSVQKQFGSNAFKTIASYEYDDVGRLKTKHLDPGYTNPNTNTPDLESLNYTYNIHNKITGINKDYALKNPANYNKWAHFFGLYLGFDNRDNVFANAKLNGQIAGLLWNTQGDDAQRKYDYTYDNAGRLVNAAFTEKQHPGDSWSNGQIDFTVSGTSGRITYDLNGNLLNMLQKGVVPGTAAPITIDNLTYTYASYSNKLQSVTDQMTSQNLNGKFGDFKDGANGGNPDYVYDVNGNLVLDLNKNAKDLNGIAGANGVKYNYLDKPEEIRIPGKGVIKVIYTADGEKIQRQFTPEPGGTTITTSYINQFIYQESSGGGGLTLQYINFEEGRIRVITPVSQSNGLDALSVDGNIDLPNGKRGAFDFFIQDYQKNVRMILTEQTHVASNTATMESARSSLEEGIFGQTGASNEVATTRYVKPAGWTGNTSSQVSRLGTNCGHNIGPNTLQKVMAGDKITATVQYYFQTPAGGNNNNFVATALGSLAQAIGGGTAATSLVKDNVIPITSQLGSVPGFVNALQPNGSNPGVDRPQAYLTILFFDERFNFIAATDGGVAQVQVAASVGANGDVLGLSSIKAPKNGYAYIYISNQSNNDVYFDHLQVGITTGNIIEENHYYAYGLKITGISSTRLGDSYEGDLRNNYLYNDKDLFEDADLDWYDYGFRNYDPQIGRFVELDPLTNHYPFLTPYQYASCDPITNIDIDGLEGGGAAGATATVARDFSYIYNTTTTLFLAPARAATSAAAVANVASGVGRLVSIGSMVFHAAVTISNTINTTITTASVGASADDEWKDLTKEALEELVNKYSPRTFTSQGQKEDYMGNIFEQNFHFYASKLWSYRNYMPNSEPDELDDGEGPAAPGHSGGNKAIIDAKMDVTDIEIGRKAMTGKKNRIKNFANAAWIEVKASKHTIWLSTRKYQILKELKLLKQNHPEACDWHVAQYIVVTTASKTAQDLKVGWSVYDWGARNGIEVINMQPQYRIVNGDVEVRFGAMGRVGMFRGYVPYGLVTKFIF